MRGIPISTLRAKVAWMSAHRHLWTHYDLTAKPWSTEHNGSSGRSNASIATVIVRLMQEAKLISLETGARDVNIARLIRLVHEEDAHARG